MKHIPAVIERALDGTYSVYCKDEIFSGMGDTIEDAKADMLKQMDFYVAAAKEEGLSQGLSFNIFNLTEAAD